MKFNDRYEILELIATNAESTTFSARDVTRQTSVMIHVIPAHSEAAASLVGLARRNAGQNRPVLEVGECKGAPFVATDVIPDFHTLREWLENIPQPGVASEFTRMFGSFEQLSQTPSKKESTGNMPPAALEPRVAGEDAGRHEVGDFTRMFHAPKKPDVSPAPDNSWVPKLEWTDSNAAAETRYPLTAEPSLPPAPAPAPSPQVEPSPSEFTRIVAKPQAEPAESPAPAKIEQASAPVTPLPPVASPSPSYVPLILGLAVLFLLAVIVVLYFALKDQ